MGKRTIVNRHDLPETLVAAVSLDQHWLGGDISVTTLIDAPQKRLLKKEQGDYEEDVADMMYALFGTATHHMLEMANIPDIRRRAFLTVIESLKEIAEKEIDKTESERIKAGAKWLFSMMELHFPEIKGRYLFELRLIIDVGGWVLSGTLDIYDTITKIVNDYKVCSTYQYVNPESQKKWRRQLNIYCFMLMKHGYEVLGAEIIAIFRDWSRAKLLRDKRYPERQTMRIKQELYSPEVIHEYILKRVELHKNAEETGDIPECTPEERWFEAGSWAAMVPTSTKAKKAGFDDEDVAKRWVNENKHKYPGLYLERRDGNYGRYCKDYCSVKDICPQHKRLKEGGA